MTSLRQAAQQALEFCEFLWHEVVLNDWAEGQREAAEAALRAALAEPMQEPVAWRWGYRSITTGEMDWRGYVEIPSHPNLRSPAIIMEPLYTAPPQRKPLTTEQVELLWFRCNWTGKPNVGFAREIEKAHGIGD